MFAGSPGGMRAVSGGVPGSGDALPPLVPVPPAAAPGTGSRGSRRDPPGADPPILRGCVGPRGAQLREIAGGERDAGPLPAPNPPCVSPRYLLLGQAGVGGAALPVGGDAAHGATGQAPRPAGGSRVRAGGAGGWSRRRRRGRGGAARPRRDGAGRGRGGDGAGSGGMEVLRAGGAGGGRWDA